MDLHNSNVFDRAVCLGFASYDKGTWFLGCFGI